MIPADLPKNEAQRLRKLYELEILDTIEEQAYDDLTRLAATICETPIALVSLVDKDRQWFKSRHGLDAAETPRDVAFCAHAIHKDDVFVVENSDQDERFFDNPLVTGGPKVKFYAGAPLIMSDNSRLGTLCVIAHQPQELAEDKIQALEALARQVVTQMELRLKLKELEMLDKTKDEFIAIVSHEIRTPLTSIYGSLSLLMTKMKDNLTKKQQHMIDISYRNTDRLLKLVNDMLDLTKLESGVIEFTLKPVECNVIIQQIVSANEEYFRLCDVSVEIQGTESPVYIKADEQRIHQVLTNLLTNAAKFTHPTDTIIVKLSTDKVYATIEVIDHGPGISEHAQAHVFQKFKQLDTHIDQKLPGTGLGLSICKKVVEAMHGSINFKSEPGIKTRFYFSLPLSSKQ